jgi:hypothetical protein
MLAARYAGVAPEALTFLMTLEACCSPDQTVWFLTADDYHRAGEAAFRWNECELMALEEAAGDEAWQAEITVFWDGHFPVMLAVHSDYDYVAVRVSDGAVVHGCAPEWEQPTLLAPSFASFLSDLAREAAEPRGRWPFTVFLGAAGPLSGLGG